MTTYPANQLLKKFGKAVTALSNNLPKDERDIVNQAWVVVESALKFRSADLEALAEYKTLVNYIQNSYWEDDDQDWIP